MAKRIHQDGGCRCFWENESPCRLTCPSLSRYRINNGLRTRRRQNRYFPSKSFRKRIFPSLLSSSFILITQGFKNHKLHDPLIEPGSADLTADVDFAALKWAATHPRKEEEWLANLTYGTVDQKDFLTKMGIDVRLQQLLAMSRNEEETRNLKSGHRMLTDPNEMGTKFKFLALYPAVMEKILQRYPPPGFS